MTKLSDEEIEQARSDIVSVISSYGVELTAHGKEYRALCPFHKERTPSFTVVPEKQIYKCFGCGSCGSSIDFVMHFANTDFRSAVQLINNGTTSGVIAPIKSDVDHTPEWVPLSVVPDDAPQPMDILNQKINGQWVKMHSSQHWAYRNTDGSLYGYVYRFELPDGGKITAPQTWCKNSDGECAWRWKSFAKPRPVFGLDQLTANPLADVLIVEGEKTAEASRQLTDMVVLSWCGGVNAVKFTDWSVLSGRTIYLWPDADQKEGAEGNRIPFMEQPGVAAMRDIYALCGKPSGARLVIPPSDVPDGWDLADPLPENFNVRDYLDTAIALSDFTTTPVTTTAITVKKKTKAELHDENESKALKENIHFKLLGYDRDLYYVFAYEKGQIVTNKKSDFSESGMVELAPLEWWEEQFGGKNGINRMMALNWIMRKSHSRGIYDISRIRGRGAWTDKGDIVFHHGDFLTINNERREINEFESHYVYEMRKKFPDISDTPLSDEDGAFLLETARKFRWAMPASAALLTGWIALAPICGALTWRPHVWINGGPGAGKSSVLENFIHPLLNNTDLYVQGNSSEAGIRQELLGDAMPVIFDESESNNEKDSSRIQSILSLIRQSSSESQARTLKGTASGSALAFHIRSMFCLASIQVGLKQQPDMERVAVLSLRPAKDDPNALSSWEEIKERFYKIRQDHEMPGRLIRRSLQLLPTILHNIHVFSTAAARKFGNQRDGDQYGALLAGAWSLISTAKVTPEDAADYIDGYQWTEYREYRDTDDSQRAMMALMGSMIRTTSMDVTVSELLMIACHRGTSSIRMTQAESLSTLERYGMRVEDDRELIICNNHTNLNSLVSSTPFAADLRSVLLRYPGTKKLEKTYKFNGMTSRAYSIPLTDLLDDKVQF